MGSKCTGSSLMHTDDTGIMAINEGQIEFGPAGPVVFLYNVPVRPIQYILSNSAVSHKVLAVEMVCLLFQHHLPYLIGLFY